MTALQDPTLGQLYDSHRQDVLQRARRLLGDDQEAGDVLHDVFLALLRDPPQVQPGSSSAALLSTMATHACFNRLRNQRNRSALLARELGWRSNSEEAHGEKQHLVHTLLVRLPEHLTLVAIYYFVHEMTHREIAAMLRCSRRKVCRLCSQARQVMAEIVQLRS